MDEQERATEGMPNGSQQPTAGLSDTRRSKPGAVEQTSVGEYQLIHKIGGGGMGVVYEARHKRLKRRVAIKLLPTRHLSDPIASARFFREMEAAGALVHRNIVQATDAGESDAVPYLVMELVSGLDLARVVRVFGVLPPIAAFEIIEQVAEALAHIHAHKMVHRDVKPSNLLLSEEGIVKVTDLGLAHFLDRLHEQDDLTASGDVIGTFDYMAPEQARNPKLADHRADIYGLGCCLHYLLLGVPVYASESRADSLIAHRSDDVPDLVDRSQIPLPQSANALFKEMLAKHPNNRPQSAQEVLQRARSTRQEICNLIAERDIRQKHKLGKSELPVDAGLQAVVEAMFADTSTLTLATDSQPPTLPADYLSRKRTRWPNALRRAVMIAFTLMLLLFAASAARKVFWPQGAQVLALVPSDASGRTEPLIPPVERAASGATVLRRHAGAAFNVHFSADGQYIVSCGSDGAVRVWDLASKRQRQAMSHARGPQDQHVIDVLLVPDSRLAVSVCYNGTAVVWDWLEGRELHTFSRHHNRVEGVAWIRGTRVLTSGMDDALYVWDAENGNVIARLDNEHQGGVRALAVDSAGRRAVTGDYEGQLFLWDLDRIGDKLVARVDAVGEDANLWCVDWVDDTDQIVIGGLYRAGTPMLLTYDLEQHCKVKEFPGHKQKVNGVCVSRDGQRLYSAGENVRAWSIATGEQLLEFNGHNDEVFGIDESPDGKHLGTGGTDGTIRIVALPPDILN